MTSKHGVLFVAFLLLLCGRNAHTASSSPRQFEDPHALLTAYFDCLKKGDVHSIQRMAQGRLLKEKRRLLFNKNYPDVLRRHYRDSELLSTQVTFIAEDLAEGRMTVLRGSREFHYRLILFRSADHWYVAEDVSQ